MQALQQEQTRQVSWQDSLVFRAGFALAAGAYERNEPICFQGVAAAAETIFLPETATLRKIPGPGGGLVERAVFPVQVAFGKPLDWRSTASPQFLGCWDQRRLVL